ncbi:ABC transporter substrate-binding protein [Paenibacillus pabuli]|uniref:ABC transporter substrate-binding protein n=1 Tax=Paenibacillus pabuli TaxID=1472 RepID=UPI001FFE45CB|nr:extracellular solute-binding protein [Paenibacillus pabuli]UPK43212.1 extracellular solute-binding protein [Paenibacillus pabuli]
MRKSVWLVMLSIVLLLSACAKSGGVSPASSSKGAPIGASQGVPTNDSQSLTVDGKKTVVVSVLRKNRFMESAVRSFEEKHKDIQIEIKEYKASTGTESDGTGEMLSEADVEKYVQSVTTQAISGKGADLILMNNLPQDKFVDKKLLVDLNDLIAKDSSFDQNALYANILKASQDGDGLYVMPLSISLETVQGNTSLLKQANISVDKNKPWSWSEFKDVANKLQQQGGYEGYYNMAMSPLLYDYIEENYEELVGQGKPNFDSEMFRSMMKEVKSIYDEGLLSEGFTSDPNKAIFKMVGIMNPMVALTMSPDFDYYQKPSAGGKKVGVPFKTMDSFGINSKSDVQAEAWEFIKFLLSDEIQASPDLFGLPVNKVALDKKLNEVLQVIESGTIELPIPKEQLPSSETLKSRIAEVQKLVAEAGALRSGDMKVLTIALEEFESFKSGQKSAEEVSKLIQNRVTTYLNE